MPVDLNKGAKRKKMEKQSAKFGLIALLLLISASLAVTGCGGGGDDSGSGGGQEIGDFVRSDKNRNMSPDVQEEELQELVAGNTRFAFDLYHAVIEDNKNLFYSPLSISLALAMTYAGARTNTEQQMAETLHFTLSQEHLHPSFNKLCLILESRNKVDQEQNSKGFRLNIANAIWGSINYTFRTDFLDVLAVNYNAGMRLLDFEGNPEDSRLFINEWVSDQTEKRIQDLLPQGSIDFYTRLVLTNAVYFNASWLYPFEEKNTCDTTFYLLDGSEVVVPMMSQEKRFGYAYGDGYMAMELFYDGFEPLSMVIIVPDIGRFSEIESLLDSAKIAQITEALSSTNIQLTMPKFTFESGFTLAQTLSMMGMPDAFIRDVADFSGIDGTRALFIDDILHKAFVSVDESGTEAAAATGVVGKIISIPPPPVEVTINRPFIFLIRDFETEAMLFVGRVMNPE
jgi:serpin B